MKTLRSLTLAAIAAMSLSASAGVITLVSPKEGETVVNPGHFPDKTYRPLPCQAKQAELLTALSHLT